MWSCFRRERQRERERQVRLVIASAWMNFGNKTQKQKMVQKLDKENKIGRQKSNESGLKSKELRFLSEAVLMPPTTANVCIQKKP